jgi:signal peptidase I
MGMSDLTENNEPAEESAAEASVPAADAPATIGALSAPAEEIRHLADDPDPQRMVEEATNEPAETKSGSHASPASGAADATKSEGSDSTPPVQGESWVETVKTVAYALLIALVIRTFLFQPFNIPSGSMENTLLIGDYLFVEKFAYGYSRYSFPFGFPPFSGRVFGASPQRGDVIVFRFPPNPSVDYIKRCIGLPGDTVQVINAQVWINGKPVPRVRAGDATVPDEIGVPKKVERFRETLPNGKSYFVLGHDVLVPGDEPQNMEERYRGDNTQVYVVPPGHYLMMGDNRENSSDSRLEVGGFGFVPAENLEGKAEFIFFSTNGDAQLWELWKWPWAVRYNRLFTVID